VRDPRLEAHRAPLAVFVIFLGVVAASACALFVLKLGASPDHVRAFYRGDAARFASPRTLEGLLEVAVPHLLAIPLVIFTAAHLVAFTALVRRGPLTQLRRASFVAALVSIAAGMAVRFVSPGFAAVKVAAFVALEAALVAWIALLLGLLLGSPVTVARAGRPAEARATTEPGPAR
jgi:hypothetical protein